MDAMKKLIQAVDAQSPDLGTDRFGDAVYRDFVEQLSRMPPPTGSPYFSQDVAYRGALESFVELRLRTVRSLREAAPAVSAAGGVGPALAQAGHQHVAGAGGDGQQRVIAPRTGVAVVAGALLGQSVGLADRRIRKVMGDGVVDSRSATSALRLMSTYSPAVDQRLVVLSEDCAKEKRAHEALRHSAREWIVATYARKYGAGQASGRPIFVSGESGRGKVG